ncbi:reverse transcriptase domain, reverse transcriptase zinc-binding domain protein [Tanacetum coccineum]
MPRVCFWCDLEWGLELPVAYYNLSPVLNLINVPVFNSDHDSFMWRSHEGVVQEFCISNVWHTICGRGEEIDWFYLVWSSYCIPRHEINLWLIMRKRLKTQDRLRQWDVGNDVDLNPCKTQKDSHEHLFFVCPYSAAIRNNILKVADLPSISPIWADILNWLLPISKRNNVTSIHGKGDRNPAQVTQMIVNVVRLKLASIRFKKSVRMDNMRTWKLANGGSSGSGGFSFL